jgi:regulator of protease activity HflC (stomatin/prohibitin superfamily)
MIRERQRSVVSGLGALFVLLALLLVAGREVFEAMRAASLAGVLGWLLVLVADAIALGGLFVVNPNEGRVLQLFGAYRGTVRAPGLRWANPFYTKKRISLRVRNFESGRLKVNDTDGNPIEIAAVVVWRVVDTVEACFEVDDYENYVKVQSEAAVRWRRT